MKTDEATRLDSSSFDLLAGGLAHDYNNMLTAMLGGMDLILCDDIPDSAREAAEDVKGTMLKAATLVRRMLSCATGAASEPEPLDLGEAVGDVVRIMRRSIPDNVMLSYRRPEGLPKVEADAAMVWQAVMNLVVNACDAIGGESGTMAIEVRPVEVAGAPRLVEVSVKDSGCGMDEATRKRIFDPLFTTKPNGNGLGLASVRSVMETMHGAVEVESEPGKGSTFRLLFPIPGAAGEGDLSDILKTGGRRGEEVAQPCPCAAAAQEAPGGEKDVASAQQCPDGRRDGPATVLVVDDDASIVKLLKIILCKAGYCVVSAQSGEEGLDVYHAGHDKISMCLIDASMGAGMNGLDLCAAIRAEDANLPLVLMSAYRAKEMNDRMASSGVTTFLPKPFRGGDVVALCDKYTGGAR